MNAFLAFGRVLINHREKVLLAIMLLVCAVLALLVYGPKGDDGDEGPVTVVSIKNEYFGATTRNVDTPVARELANAQPWDHYASLRSVVRPSAGATTARLPGQAEIWPEIVVKRVWKPSEESEWMVQLEVQGASGQRGRSYIGREGLAFANKFELTRIDKTRLCIEVLRQSDSDTKEFCQQ